MTAHHATTIAILVLGGGWGVWALVTGVHALARRRKRPWWRG